MSDSMCLKKNSGGKINLLTRCKHRMRFVCDFAIDNIKADSQRDTNFRDFNRPSG